MKEKVIAIMVKVNHVVKREKVFVFLPWTMKIQRLTSECIARGFLDDGSGGWRERVCEESNVFRLLNCHVCTAGEQRRKKHKKKTLQKTCAS